MKNMIMFWLRKRKIMERVTIHAYAAKNYQSIAEYHAFSGTPVFSEVSAFYKHYTECEVRCAMRMLKLIYK